jgi:putative nucleotidyltransferase with HDIG domain
MLPTALAVLLPGIFIGRREALVFAVALPLGALVSGCFDMASYIFAASSGITASLVLENAKKRMDLFRAGIIVAIVNIAVIVALFLQRHTPFAAYPGALFWAGFNGLASGLLVLGLLPPLENALSAATLFRLIELSDVNAPILKRLFTTAPGTYSHSMMVANLAEAACEEIGANALLARVGGYYHDIGKMEQPDYFVENQDPSFNKHTTIAPRLSATVLRSHVKLGVEKARSLGLPREVIEIISEHHGNSLIVWFYNAALKKEGHVNKEDFMYPGTPPRSKEAACVMLADVTEAAVRTLKKPGVSRLEKYIHELIMGKFNASQLTNSDLTFRDLDTIEQTFVRVLAGYYHSRIEYPKQKEVKASESNGNHARGNGSSNEVHPTTDAHHKTNEANVK